MPDNKILGLPQVTVAAAGNELAIVKDGVTSRISAQDLKTEGIRVVDHVVTAVTTTQTVTLSTTNSVNVINVSNPGLTLTLQFPTSPVEGQVVQFTTLTNTVTLIVGSGGTFSVNPTFAGAPTAGFKATYVYHDTDNTYYLIG